MHHLEVKFTILKKFPSQCDFAIFIGESEVKISQVLRGRRKLSQEEAEKWSKALDCDLALLESVTQQKRLRRIG